MFVATMRVAHALMFILVCSFLGESLDSDGSMVFAYYKEGAANPTFLFPKYALKEEKC